MPTQLSFNPSIFHATPQTNSLTCNLTSISFLIRPRLGLVISGVTRFCPLRLPARLPAYTRLGHCYSTRPPHQHHPRVPWPYAFTSTVMSSSEDDQPLGKGTSRACFRFICLGDAALQSVPSVCFLTKSRASGDLVKILFPASPRPSCASSQIGSTFLTYYFLFSSRANYLSTSSTSISFNILPRHPS